MGDAHTSSPGCSRMAQICKPRKKLLFLAVRQQSSACSQHTLPVPRAYADTCCRSGWAERPMKACELLHCIWSLRCILSSPAMPGRICFSTQNPSCTRGPFFSGTLAKQGSGWQAGQCWVHPTLLASLLGPRKCKVYLPNAVTAACVQVTE